MPARLRSFAIAVLMAVQLAGGSRLSADDQKVATGELDIRKDANGDIIGPVIIRYAFPNTLSEGTGTYLPNCWGDVHDLGKPLVLNQSSSVLWRRIGYDRLIAIKNVQELSYSFAPMIVGNVDDFRKPFAGNDWVFAFGAAVLLPKPPAGTYKVTGGGSVYSNILSSASPMILGSQLSDSFFLIGDGVRQQQEKLSSGAVIRKAWASGLTPDQIASSRIISEAVEDLASVTGTWPDVYSVALVPYVSTDGSSSFHGTAVRNGAAILLSGSSNLIDHRLALYHEIAHQITGYETGVLSEGEIPSADYWFYEGITDAIARIVLLEKGRISEEEYRDSWSTVLQSLDRADEDLTDASGAEAGGQDVLPASYQYWRGALIGLALHFEIQKSLKQEDGLLFAIRQSAKVSRKQSPLENFKKAVLEISPSASQALEIRLANSQKMDFRGSLAYQGCLKIRSASRARYELGFAFNGRSDGTYLIESVSEGSMAHRAGLRKGMVVTKIIQSSGGDPDRQTIFEVTDANKPRIFQFYPRTAKQYVTRSFSLCRAAD